LLPVAGINAALSDAADASNKDKSVKASSKDPLSSLKEGMPADAVRKLLGQPDAIRPMKTDEGKAEVWIFTREVSRRVDQIRIDTPDVVVEVRESDGTTRRQVTSGQVQFQDVHYLTEETVELLMFNGQYVVHKVSRAERKL